MADFEYVRPAEMKGPKPPLDFSYHYSRVTAARKESNVKSFYKYFQIPGIGNLAGGMFGNRPRHIRIDNLKRIRLYPEIKSNADYSAQDFQMQVYFHSTHSKPKPHNRNDGNLLPTIQTIQAKTSLLSLLQALSKRTKMFLSPHISLFHMPQQLQTRWRRLT